jgi:hypothetical protein
MILDLVSQAFSLGCRNRALQAQNLDATTYCFAIKKVDDLLRGEGWGEGIWNAVHKMLIPHGAWPPHPVSLSPEYRGEGKKQATAGSILANWKQR